MVKKTPQSADEEQEKALAALKSLGAASNPLGSALAEAANKTIDHFKASGADPNDRIELWGKRAARLAALFALIWLVISLLQDFHILAP